MARFYGWNAAEIENMPFNVFETYRKAIEPLKSIEALEQISFIQFPNRKEQSQKEVLKKIEAPLKPFQKTKSFDQIDDLLRGL